MQCTGDGREGEGEGWREWRKGGVLHPLFEKNKMFHRFCRIMKKLEAKKRTKNKTKQN